MVLESSIYPNILISPVSIPKSKSCPVVRWAFSGSQNLASAVQVHSEAELHVGALWRYKVRPQLGEAAPPLPH